MFGAVAVGVRGHFHRYVRIVAEHLGEFVEGGFRLGPQGCFVEIVEYVFHYVGLAYRGENEVDRIVGVLFGSVGGELLLGVEVALCTGEHHVANSPPERE